MAAIFWQEKFIFCFLVVMNRISVIGLIYMYSCMIVINHGIAAPVADAMTEEDVDVSIGYWIF